MLKILSDGEATHRVEDSTGMKIGWINDRTIGYRGFATLDLARDAAVAAWRAFDRALRQQYAGWPRDEPKLDQLRTMHDGVDEWFHDGSSAIARLLRPRPGARHDSFGIELALPSYATEGVAIAVAHSVATATKPYRELARSRAADMPDMVAP